MTGPVDRPGDIERISHLLSHPVRVRLIQVYARKPTSSTEASDELGIPLGNVSYHTKILFEEGSGLLEVATKKQVRGAVETFYRLKPWPKRSAQEEESLSAEGARRFALELLVDTLAAGDKIKVRRALADGIVRVPAVQDGASRPDTLVFLRGEGRG